ncbi:MAG: hypothetical protein M1524_03510 [Patescibacteria group bacterium]|nr:hypothetical protein [Patescibacteria group bacterium]
MSNDFTDEQKNEIEKRIVETAIDGIERNVLAEDQLALISSFVLEKIDNIKNTDELIFFLKELTSKWEIFSQIQSFIERQGNIQQEAKVAEDVSRLANDGKIDEAISLAKATTNN